MWPVHEDQVIIDVVRWLHEKALTRKCVGLHSIVPVESVDGECKSANSEV